MMRADRAWHLILGPTLWGIWFVAVYGGLSVLCAATPAITDQSPWTWINLTLWVFTLMMVGLLLRWGWRCWRVARAADPEPSTRQGFISSLSAGLYLMSALATLFIGLPILVLPPCN